MAEYIGLDTPLELYVDRGGFYRQQITSLRELLNTNKIPYTAADVVERDEGIRIGAELAAMHGSDATSEELSKAYFDGYEQGYEKAMSERKRGKWIKIKYRSICRDCSFRGFASWNFCPNCGADMREADRAHE